jgi:hypothetical protein
MKLLLPIAALLIIAGVLVMSSTIGHHEEITLFGSTIDPRYLQVGGLFCAIGGILTILSSLRGVQAKSS